MQNEPNFSKSQMFVTVISTRNYNAKYKLDTWSKRTQTNPTCSELVEPISKGRRGIYFASIATIFSRLGKIEKKDWVPDREASEQQSRISASLRGAVLRAALGLDVFSVIDEPVNMSILREQLNRLFIKKYNNDIFAE
jgi:hypothetical protein